MKFSQPLQSSRLKKRYKRFLADVKHPDLGEMTVHCPNTGSMLNCWDKGWTAWLLDSHNPKRKYRYTWVISENDKGEKIGVNTHFANQLVWEALQEDKIPELSGQKRIQKEVKYGEENSRIDFLLSDHQEHKTYVEVKSVTLLNEDGLGLFPDSVTTRGQKHLRELMQCKAEGHRAVLFFMVQHSGIKQVAVASHIDPVYAALLKEAVAAGVEVLVYDSLLSITEIKLNCKLSFIP